MKTQLLLRRCYRPRSRRFSFRTMYRPMIEHLEARIVPSSIDHGAGFTSHADLTNNGAASFSGSVARLTDGGPMEAGSVFTNARFNVTQFTTQFTLVQTMGTNPTGGGLTFTIENDPRGPTALGPPSSGLGYGPDTPGGPPGIINSLAIKFDLYDNFGEGNNSTGIFTGGRSPTVREPGLDPSLPDMSVSLDGSGIDLHGQDVLQVTLSYDGVTLAETIRDGITGATFNTSYHVNLPGLLGGNMAYVGFTGGSGGFTAIQDIEGWTGVFASPAVSFFAPSPYVGGPASAVGDFNGDGIPDLAVSRGGLVSILLGKGDGSFQAPQDYAVTGGALSLVVGDFNGDGHLDIVTNSGTMLLGNGDGTFRALQAFAPTASQIAVGDFNRDGKLDLAIVTYSGDPALNTLRVLLGNGDGTFQSPVSYDAGYSPTALVVGDFNGDGIPDLAVANGFEGPSYYTQLSVALGRGDGTFGTFYSYAPDVFATALTVGDFNGDGKVDIVTSSGFILFGNGDGSFQAPRRVFEPTLALAAGDFNGDGHLDLAVSVASGVSILLGNGDGTFQNAASYAAAGNPASIAIADLNRDGHADIVATANGVAGNVGALTVLLNNGDGTFHAAKTFPDGEGAGPMVVADLNGDGKQDVVTANFVYSFTGRPLFRWDVLESDVEVFLSNGDGTFQAARSYKTGGAPLAVALGDFNGDGIPDLVVANGGVEDFLAPPDHTIGILLGNGDGSFQPAQTYAVGSGPFSVAVGDFNSDGHLDFAVADASGVIIFLGKGDGTFAAGQRYTGVAGSLLVADFNRDGKLDIATSGGNLLLGNGDGTFKVGPNYAGQAANAMTVDDFNGDGIPDLAVLFGAYPAYQGTVTIFLGTGDGTFQAARSYAVGLYPEALAVGDFNRDGISDLAVANHYSHTVSILLGNGDGSFQAAQDYAAGSYPDSLAVADFNGDGLADLAVGDDNYPGTLTLLLNTTNPAGGQAATPPEAREPRLTAHRIPESALLAALAVASQPRAFRLAPPSLGDVQSSALARTPLDSAAGGAADIISIFVRHHPLISRSSRDTLFDWAGNNDVDSLAISLVQTFL